MEAVREHFVVQLVSTSSRQVFEQATWLEQTHSKLRKKCWAQLADLSNILSSP
jgi:hypothetical protein